MAGFSRFQRPFKGQQGPARALQKELRRALNAKCAEIARPAAPHKDGALAAARQMHTAQAQALRADFLTGAIHASALARGLADLADINLHLLLRDTLAQEPQAPCGFAVFALGKYGGRELTFTSDLDLLFVHNGHGPEAAYACEKIARRFIQALSATTEDGPLFDVDLRLRPHGDKGGLVASMDAFHRYYSNEAWTWELMALTRLRPVAGDEQLCARVRSMAHQVLRLQRSLKDLLADIAAMRGRLDLAHPASGPLDVKYGPGGLVDVEFAAQAGMLISAQTSRPVLESQTRAALSALAQQGVFEESCAKTLLKALSFFSAIQQAQRAAPPGADAYGGRRAELEGEARALRPMVRQALAKLLETRPHLEERAA